MAWNTTSFHGKVCRIEKNSVNLDYNVDWMLNVALGMAEGRRMGQQWDEKYPGWTEWDGGFKGSFAPGNTEQKAFFDNIITGSIGSKITDVKFLLDTANNRLEGDFYLTRLRTVISKDSEVNFNIGLRGTGALQILSTTTKTWGQNSVDDYGQMADCLIYEAEPDTSQESDPGGEYLGMGKGGAADRTNRSVIQFDIKSDLEGLGATTIVSAKIYGYLIWAVVGNHNVSAYRVLQNWVEAEVTWNSFSSGNAWNTAGCAAASDGGVDDGSYDRLATAEDTIALADGLASGSYALILDITSLAQEWLDGTAKEYGVLLQSDNEAIGKYVGANESEGTDIQRPYLEIEYS